MTTSGHPDTESGQPPIPGIRYRVEKRTRMVPTTIDGDTRMVPNEYYVQIPIPPRDWDAIFLRGVTTVAVAVTGVEVAWSAASIGSLLSSVVHDAIAYGAASVFSAGWLTCQVIEWLERYDPDRAKVARAAGWLALLIAMGAILAQGVRAGQPVAGGVGMAVSLIAKGLWTILMRHFAVPLGQGVGGWLHLRRQEVAAQRALSGELRRMKADEAYTAAVYGDVATAARGVTQAAELPAMVPSVSAPVQAAASPMSAPSDVHDTAQASSQPSGDTVPARPDIRPDGPDSRPAAVPTPVFAPADAVPPTSGQGTGDTAPDMSPAVVAPIGQSIAGTIRTALADVPGITDDGLLAHVRSVHGDRKNLADTVTRTRRRVERRAS
ncbi:hypothetical protein EYS09_22190 [Streptomyces kasugaensis]|uniref:Protein transporter Sec31 n=1 Tax=Streptomyces kasugaensis TaxID=1946 RepID=A0A4Q9HRC8_STRKA|nr:hypothetical protein [Streptomyces kasugaensis]TBO57524.1 hypothetical protein EYS09_22190 [Streptomyces kasugaensis]